MGGMKSEFLEDLSNIIRTWHIFAGIKSMWRQLASSVLGLDAGRVRAGRRGAAKAAQEESVSASSQESCLCLNGIYKQ